MNAKAECKLIMLGQDTTIRRCHRILVIDGGRITEDGTYDELIEKGGLFSELVAGQQLDTGTVKKGYTF